MCWGWLSQSMRGWLSHVTTNDKNINQVQEAFVGVKQLSWLILQSNMLWKKLRYLESNFKQENKRKEQGETVKSMGSFKEAHLNLQKMKNGSVLFVWSLIVLFYSISVAFKASIKLFFVLWFSDNQPHILWQPSPGRGWLSHSKKYFILKNTPKWYKGWGSQIHQWIA